jgi:hypothetical protein
MPATTGSDASPHRRLGRAPRGSETRVEPVCDSASLTASSSSVIFNTLTRGSETRVEADPGPLSVRERPLGRGPPASHGSPSGSTRTGPDSDRPRLGQAPTRTGPGLCASLRRLRFIDRDGRGRPRHRRPPTGAAAESAPTRPETGSDGPREPATTAIAAAIQVAAAVDSELRGRPRGYAHGGTSAARPGAAAADSELRMMPCPSRATRPGRGAPT